MKVTDPGVQIYARQLGVSPAMALRRLQVEQIGRETKDYDSTIHWDDFKAEAAKKAKRN